MMPSNRKERGGYSVGLQQGTQGGSEGEGGGSKARDRLNNVVDGGGSCQLVAIDGQRRSIQLRLRPQELEIGPTS